MSDPQDHKDVFLTGLQSLRALEDLYLVSGQQISVS